MSILRISRVSTRVLPRSSRIAADTLIAFSVSAALAYLLASGRLGLLVLVFAATLAVFAPVHWVAFAACLIANGAASVVLPDHTSRPMFAAAGLAMVAAARSLARNGISIGHGMLGAALILLFTPAFLRSGTSGPLSVLTVSAPYMLMSLGLLSLPLPQRTRLVRWLAVSGAFLSFLYVISAVSGFVMVPGTYRTLPVSFLGLSILRIWAPGGLLSAFAFAVALSESVRKRTVRQTLVLILSIVAMALTLSRTLVVAVAITSIVFAIYVQARARMWNTRGRTLSFGLIFLTVVSAPLANARFANLIEDGSYNARAEAFYEAHQLLLANGGQPVGFSHGPFDYPDSSVATLLVRFGTLTVVCTFVLLLIMIVAQFNMVCFKRRDTAASRDASVFFAILILLMGFSTDALSSFGGLSLFGLAISAICANDSPNDARSGLITKVPSGHLLVSWRRVEPA
jgi:hypothetical protein